LQSPKAKRLDLWKNHALESIVPLIPMGVIKSVYGLFDNSRGHENDYVYYDYASLVLL
jgi:hypothetical protein